MRDATEIDIAIGARVKRRRDELGVTQSQLAEAVGVTFQQVQKYERGSNRIAASRLYNIAIALNVSVLYFYQDYEMPSADPDYTRMIQEAVVAASKLKEAAEAVIALQPVSESEAPNSRKSPQRQRVEKLYQGEVGGQTSFVFGTFAHPKALDNLARTVGGSGWYTITVSATGQVIKKIK